VIKTIFTKTIIQNDNILYPSECYQSSVLQKQYVDKEEQNYFL